MFLVRKWRNLQRFCESSANNLRKLMVAAPCPQCGVMIYKDGGCAHMNCGKCKYEFCWACMGQYKSYRHDPGMDYRCGQATTAKGSIILLIVFLILQKSAILVYGQAKGQINLPENPFTYLWHHFSWVNFGYFMSAAILAALFLAMTAFPL